MYNLKAILSCAEFESEGRGLLIEDLSTETVESAALTLEGVDDVEGGDGLALGVFGVGDGVADDTLEEGLEDAASLFVDHYDEAR